ncbi:MAG: class I SAM-dependent methyltransferase [Planctomycetaceae bacterium]|nr:class I SAM-dependent methyltransferase [Planctomycetaceae bacterium]
MSSCQICLASEGETFVVQERMFGTREEFEYFECADCGCLQLEAIPEEMSRYYPSGYYSFGGESRNDISTSGFKTRLKQKRDQAVLMGQTGAFRLLANWYPNPELEKMSRWFIPTGVRSLKCSILDVGCGAGDLLKRLHAMGFSNLTGIDPYRETSDEAPGLKLLAQNLEELGETPYDLIMLHHTFEHLPDPIQVLQDIERKLTPNGCCVIRIPVKSEGAWKRYGVHWGEIDAPRHFFLHTEESLSRAAKSAGLEVFDTLYEDDPFPYYLSELYLRDISLSEIQNGTQTEWERIFSAEELEQMKQLARENNRPGFASRAAFLLKPSESV